MKTISNKFNYFIALFSFCVAILCYFTESYSAENRAREMAREAYHQIEGNVFNGDEIEDAMKKLSQAKKINEKEPLIYLGESLAVLVIGFKSDDWYEMENFQQGTVGEAIKIAEHAYSLNKDLSPTYSHLARLHIIKKEFELAQQLLNKAKAIDSKSFYPWYFQGILYEKTMKLEDAKTSLTKAESLAIFPYHRLIVNGHRQKIAYLENNYNEQERLLLKDIKNLPNSPHAYGNYGSFLLDHGRIEEAIIQLEKAIRIAPYPLALRRLDEARELARKKRNDLKGKDLSPKK
jgi:tetratricopeptide (TPR) repeat protein